MKLPELSVRNPVAVLMIFFAGILLGLVSISQLNIDLLPEVEPPQVSVLTYWPGASASDVESEVTKYIEDQLTTVNNLETLASKSFDNLSAITCKFKWGANLDVATNDIRDRLDLARRDLPEDIKEPLIFKFSSATMPILFLSATADVSYPYLYQLVDKRVSDELKRVPGVAAIALYGGLKRQIRVHFEKERLEAFQIPLNQIKKVVTAENLNLPAGNIKMGKRDYFIRVPGRFREVEEIGNTVIGQSGGRLIYLKDVARVEDSFEEEMVKGWGDGRSAIVLLLQKQTGTNTVQVIRGVKQKLREMEKWLPSDVRVDVVYDTSEFIDWSVQNLKESLYIGIILISVITFLFLRRLWGSVIILLTIPFSLIISFILMYLFKYTINVVSLSSLAIVSGMVVDDAIVILENIVRHVEEGETPGAAAISGASEVGMAVAVSTLTLVAIFFPLIFITGLTAVLFNQMAFIIIVSILASLFNSLTLSPMLGSRFLKPISNARLTSGDRLKKVILLSEKWFHRLESIYGELIHLSLGHKKVVVISAAALFLGSLLLIPKVGTELIPDMDSGDINVTLRLPEGTRIEETNKVIEGINSYFAKRVPEARHYYAFDGQTEQGTGIVLGFDEAPNVGQVGAKLVKKSFRKRSAEEIAMGLREEVRKIPGINKLIVSATTPIKSVFMGGGKRISVEIKGTDLKEVTLLAEKIKGVVEGVPGTVDVGLSQKDPRPEVWVEIDRRKASSLGINVAMVADSLRTYFYGDKATGYRDAGDEYDIFFRLREKDRSRMEDLMNSPIPTLSNHLLKLRNIATLHEVYGPIEIERRDRQRMVKVEADTFGRALGDVVEDIKKGISQISIPPGMEIKFGGEVEEQEKAFRDLILLLILGIILVYMVMASQFNSLLHPFVIMFSVPFAFTGVLWTFFLTGTTLNLFSFLGLIMLMGIVVKNAIVLVDYTNLLRSRGLSLFDSIVKAGSNRLRPVLMTSLTTFFGMLPMSLSRGEGSEMWKPLGLTMMGGLLVSTLVTLILIPVVYSIFEARSDRDKN
jgi:HAE1 family hydrophobic/amphiphilic exporter-1